MMVGLSREAKTLPEKVLVAGQDRTDSGQFCQGWPDFLPLLPVSQGVLLGANCLVLTQVLLDNDCGQVVLSGERSSVSLRW